MNRRLTTLALTAAAMLALTGCTGGSDAPGSPDSQTLKEACATATESIQGIVIELESVSTEDPAAAAAAFQSAAETMAKAGDEVGNAEVAAVLPDIEDVFSNAAETMTAAASGDEAQAAELGDIGTDLETSFAKFQALCLE